MALAVSQIRPDIGLSLVQVCMELAFAKGRWKLFPKLKLWHIRKINKASPHICLKPLHSSERMATNKMKRKCGQLWLFDTNLTCHRTEEDWLNAKQLVKAAGPFALSDSKVAQTGLDPFKAT